jgi:DNA polymerase-3 subunit alpha
VASAANSETMTFVHLHLHTEYSLVDSVVRIKSDGDRRGLIDSVVAGGMPAIALTDQCNLFGMVKFYRAALARGVKPLVGVDLWVLEEGERAEPSRLVLLCQHRAGYLNLTRLVSRAWLDGQQRGRAMISRDWLDRAGCEGLIALSAAAEGDVGRALVSGREPEARAALEFWRDRFGDRYYLELQRTGRAGDELHVGAAVDLAARYGVPVVATNDVRFLQAQDFEAHEARVCIHDGTQLGDANRPRRYSEQQFLRSAAEMGDLFADLPEALDNTVEIAQRCNLELQLGASVLPEYPVPAPFSTEEFLRAESIRGLSARMGIESCAVAPADYAVRLETELGVICSMGFAGYFLIVADFIRWAREHDIPVGPGRGSGAGSLVAYALGITDLDPIGHDLLFERFLNPERVSMPDFDIDFCMEGRDRVIDYVAEKYGRERVSQIITYGSMAAKAVVRDVARVLGHNYGFADSIAKLIPFELGITLTDALAKEEELRRRYENEDDTREVIDLALSLEGLVRNAGMHAGGVVIAPSALTDFAPLYCDDAGSGIVTQFDKDDVEAVGLVKFDFLGLRTLTIIERAVQTIRSQAGSDGSGPDMAALPMNDVETFALLKRCETTAVFQLESRGMKDLVRRLQPDRFEDIVALVALFRPGPLQSGMVDDFIARKHGRIDGPIDYLHPDLKPVLTPTYGVILYQEQVMQIAQVLAGYTLGGADLLRRAMGKKKPAEMAKQRSVFVDGAVARGVDDGVARHIFDLMEKFAGYGFNKSHSAAYALLSYQTAWLKAHHPAAFMAAVLSSDMDRTDKVVTLIDECARMELAVEPPDVNRSEYTFAVAGERAIRYGLGAIKGVGQSAVENIIQERAAAGPFASLGEFCRRIDSNRMNRRVMEALIRSGSFDSTGVNRASPRHELPTAIAVAEQRSRALAAGQVDLFGLAAAAPDDVVAGAVESLPEWSEAVRLAGERDTLGLYLTGHPIAQYERELRVITSGRIADVAGGRPLATSDATRFQGRPVIVAGLVLELRKRGNRTTLMLDDRSARLEVSLFDETFQQYRSIIARDAILVIEGQLRFDEFIENWRLTAKRVSDIDQAREQFARRLIIEWPEAGNANGFVGRLEACLKPYRRGSCGVAVHYRSDRARAAVELPEEWSVRPTRALMNQLAELVGHDRVKLVFAPRLDS